MVPLRQALMKIGEEPDKVITNSLEENLKNSNKWLIYDSHVFLRGVNFENQVVIIDEAQNFTTGQLRKILTRVHDDSKVIDSRPTEEGVAIRRRRECIKCAQRFTTYEKVETLPIVVIKKDKIKSVLY